MPIINNYYTRKDGTDDWFNLDQVCLHPRISNGAIDTCPEYNILSPL